MTLAFTASRVLHLSAVWGAMALMFGPVANAYFRSVRGSAHAPGSNSAATR
ncbi:hypothetical protein AAH991_37595 [Microbispora sp. ZYX-F-249]|uniref:Uncharacterized protein n=1 Tax=Microbispora maris TaxID=3144104 RepID=A0ABV0B034_9ACTN